MLVLPAPLGPSRATTWPARADEAEPVDGQGLAVADDHPVTGHRGGPGDRVGPTAVIMGIVHGWSRYRCARHDRYPAGARRPACGEGGPRPSGGGPGRTRPARRPGPAGPGGHRPPRRLPGRGEGPLQAGGPGPQGRRRRTGRPADRPQPPTGRRGARPQRRGRIGPARGAPSPALPAQPARRRRPRRGRPRGQRAGPVVARRAARLRRGPAGAPLGDRRGAGPARHGAGGQALGLDVPPLPRDRGPADPGAVRLRPRQPRRRISRRSGLRPWS